MSGFELQISGVRSGLSTTEPQPLPNYCGKRHSLPNWDKMVNLVTLENLPVQN